MNILALSAVLVSLVAPTHTPAVDAKWGYTLTVKQAGKLVPASVTVEIVDPFGGVHPVEYGRKKKNIVNHRFRGVFRDFIKFPPESKGYKLTLRFTVKALGQKRVVKYWIKSR